MSDHLWHIGKEQGRKYVTREQAETLVKGAVAGVYTAIAQEHAKQMEALEANCNQSIRQAQQDLARMFEERLQGVIAELDRPNDGEEPS